MSAAQQDVDEATRRRADRTARGFNAARAALSVARHHEQQAKAARERVQSICAAHGIDPSDLRE